jgi:hypothetical protein
MYGSEVSEVISAYRDAGLPEPVWAAALPVNWARAVGQLVDDVYGDHAVMMEREAAAEQARLQAENMFNLPSHTSQS